MRPLDPLTYAAISSLTFALAINLSHRARLFLSPFLFATAIFSLQTSSSLSFLPGAPSYWNLFICIWIQHAASVLFFEPFHLPAGLGAKRRLVLTYKIWNDPQRQANWAVLLSQPHAKPTASSASRLIFALRRVTKLAICWILQFHAISPLFLRLRPRITDFAPTQQPYFRRLLYPNTGPPITTHETQLRAFMSIYWIWLAYLMLDAAHVLLSVIFVCVFPLDTPEEWPSLFSSPTTAYSIRNFWGRFWHRLAAPSCASSGRIVSRRFAGMTPGSRGEKTFIAFWTFLVAGVVHGLADYMAGDAAMPFDEIFFFLANFVGAAVEVLLIGEGRRHSKKEARSGKVGWVWKLGGFAWVWGFFFLVVPKWQYPKFYEVLRRRA